MISVRVWAAMALACGVLLLLVGCGGGGNAPGSNGAGDISGKISDLLSSSSTRAASSGMLVQIDGTNYLAQVADDGTFTFHHIPAGLYTLVARNGSHAGHLVVSVQAQHNTEVGEIVLANAGQISGMVRSSKDNTPIPDARVTATQVVLTDSSTQMPLPVRITRTNATGSYTLDGLPVGDYLVTIARMNFTPVSLTLTVSDGVTTPGDAKLTPIDPSTTAGTVSGTAYLVDDSGAKNPIGGVLVRLAKADDPAPMAPMPDSAIDTGGNTVMLYPSKHGPEYYSYTDSTGAYTITGVPAGAYLAVAVRPGMEADSHAVTVVATTTITQDFTLTLRKPVSGIISGAVTDAGTHAPIVNAKVYAMMTAPTPASLLVRSDSGGSAPVGSGIVTPDGFVMATVTDAQGRYQLVVPPQATSVAAVAPGYLLQTVPVTVTTGQTVTADIALTAKVTSMGTISGTITDAVTGNPIAGANVAGLTPATRSLTPATGNYSYPDPSQVTTTDANGAYSLTVPTEVTALAVSIDGYQIRQVAVTVTAGATVTMNVPLTPNSATTGMITGTVTNGDGNPIAGAAVVAFTRSVTPPPDVKGGGDSASAPVQAVQTVTNDQGVYTLKVPGATNILAAYKQGYQYKETPVTVVVGGSITVNVTLAAVTTTNVVLTGHVYLATAAGPGTAPVANAEVYLTPQNSATNGPTTTMLVYSAKTDSAGAYRLELPAGAYWTTAAKEGRLFSPKEPLTLTGNATHDYQLAPPPVTPMPPQPM